MANTKQRKQQQAQQSGSAEKKQQQTAEAKADATASSATDGLVSLNANDTVHIVLAHESGRDLGASLAGSTCFEDYDLLVIGDHPRSVISANESRLTVIHTDHRIPS